MRFETTPRFDADFKALEPEHRNQFRSVLKAFNSACDAYTETYARTGGESAPAYRWPAGLRVQPMRSAAGVWEMTWSFSGPDGRATFEFIDDDRGLLVRWRRIGDHSIYRQP